MVGAFSPGNDRHLVVDGFNFRDQATSPPPFSGHAGIHDQFQPGNDYRRQQLHQLGIPDLGAAQAGLGADGVPAVGHVVDGAGAADQRRDQQVQVRFAVVRACPGDVESPGMVPTGNGMSGVD